MIFAIARALLVGIVVLGPSASAAQELKEKVDLLLVLAADVSRSIDDRSFALQRDGYAAAMLDARVLRSMKSGQHRRVAVAFVEWADEQDVLVDWTIIGDDTSARMFADHLIAKPRSPGAGTAIGSAIKFAAELMERAPFVAERRIIDVSGDGTSNCGWDVGRTRDIVPKKDRDLVINGLVITNDSPAISAEHTRPPGGLENYYRTNVIGGPGAFVMVAQDFKTFGQTIISKMITEIALLR
jgi:Protein of unknown function (DUF1194)